MSFDSMEDNNMPPESAEAPASAALESREAGAGDQTPFGLLANVELPLTISFGKTQMALRDVLSLSVGSLVEFDSALEEPVEVRVNDTKVALGELLMVDGCYGVRITKILDGPLAL
jgi:flagellar motor switch protein FliN/FliY